MKRKYRISKRRVTLVSSDTRQFTRFVTFYRAQRKYFGFWIGITPEVEVTKSFVEFVFENCSEDRAIELANFITDKKRRNYYE